VGKLKTVRSVLYTDSDLGILSQGQMFVYFINFDFFLLFKISISKSSLKILDEPCKILNSQNEVIVALDFKYLLILSTI